MLHLGDITKINGAEIPVVDVITGGSPCQDLSVAGKRAGLDGERSGLFLEQVRVVKEMRENDARAGRTDEFIRPRYMVWENVPGALSSGKPKGADFQIVLMEICRIVCKDCPVVPIPNGGWAKSGSLSGVGDSGCPFSIAWRIHDAQFWGVPQRRKRIALVADFGGLSAPEILFERKGLSGNFNEGKQTRQGSAGTVEESAGESGAESATLGAVQDQTLFAAVDARNGTEGPINGTLQSKKTGGHTLNSCCGESPRGIALIYDARGNGGGV